MIRGPRSTNWWTAPHSYPLFDQAAGPQGLTRRAAGRRLAPSFLVLQSEKAQPHFGGAFLLGRRAAGPQGLGPMLDRHPFHLIEHLIKGLGPKTFRIGHPLRGHRTRYTALK